jgi:hypothetical protein
VGISSVRGALFVLALALCVGCMLATATIGAGGSEQFAETASSGDPLMIVVTPGAGSTSASKLDEAAVQSFGHLAGVQAATGVIMLPLRVSIGAYTADSLDVTAVDAEAFRGRLVFERGGLFSSDAGAPKIVLGYGAQMEFVNGSSGNQPADSPSTGAEPTPPPVDWLGQRAKMSIAETAQGGKTDGAAVRDAQASSAQPGQSEETEGASTAGTQARTYSGGVSGVLQQDESSRNGRAFMSIAAAKKMLQDNHEQASSLGLSPNVYARAFVFAKDMSSVRAVEEAITGLGYSVQSDVADLDGLLQVQSLQRTLLLIIEVFSAVTAALLALCILLAGDRLDQAAERARPGDRSWLARSTTLGLIGGLAAVLLACLFTLIVNTSSADTAVFGMRFGQTAKLSVPAGAALAAVGISMLCAWFSGWITHLVVTSRR